MPKKFLRPIVILISVIAALIAIYNVPFVHDRLAWRVENFITQVDYFFNPPDEAVFLPTQRPTQDAPVLPTVTATLTPSPVPTEGPTATPTITPTPLPEKVTLPGVKYVDQHNRWNYCAPANLAMSLKFWGWSGLPGDPRDVRDQIASVVKPGENNPTLEFIERGKKDKNVSPTELRDFIVDYTDYNVIVRHGGDMNMLKNLLAAGFPVIIEKGYYERDYTGKIAWLGHYLFVTGYDEARGGFIVQDAYLKPGQNLLSTYDEFQEGWRSFNYLFLVVYPPEREADVHAALGPWIDSDWANRNALAIAQSETQALSGIDGFFAWFNLGTSNVEVAKTIMGASALDAQAYFFAAGDAYDEAFRLYAGLGGTDLQRPYRMMWYQTGPYWAYYYSGRYSDVVSLANTTLNETISEPTLEESLYWRGQAYYAQGDSLNAISDLRQAVYLNPNFSPAIFSLQQWGVAP